MTIEIPAPRRYRRIKDGALCSVINVTGDKPTSDVVLWRGTARGENTWHVQLGNFWTKYEPFPATCERWCLAEYVEAWEKCSCGLQMAPAYRLKAVAA